MVSVQPCDTHCITARKPLRYKVTRADVVPPFLPTFNLFLFLVYISSFHMPRRKMYKCRGTTETAITAVCAHVWTCRPPPPFDTKKKKMKITQFVTRSMPPPHTREKPASIPEHLSQQGSATSLLMSRNLSSFLRWLSPAMLNAQWRCARLIVLAQTHSPAFSSFMLRSNRILSRSLSCLFRAIVFFLFFFWSAVDGRCHLMPV